MGAVGDAGSAAAVGAGAGATVGSVVPGIGTGIGALAGGIIGGAGSLLSSAFNVSEQRSANRTAINLSNSAHQREVADLKAAGLNPILSARLGGSSTPGITAPEAADPTTSISSGSSSAAQVQLLRAQTQKTLADTRLTNKTADNLDVTSPAQNQIPGLSLEQAKNLLAIAKNDLIKSNVTVTPKALKAQIQTILANASLAKTSSAGAVADLHKKKTMGNLWEHAEESTDSAKGAWERIKELWNAPKPFVPSIGWPPKYPLHTVFYPK